MRDKQVKTLWILLLIGTTSTQLFANCCCTEWINNKVKTIDNVAKQIVPVESKRIKKAYDIAVRLNEEMDRKLGEKFTKGIYGELITTEEGELHHDKKTVFLLNKLRFLKNIEKSTEISNSKNEILSIEEELLNMEDKK